MSKMDIGIDLGTANTLVYLKGKGIIIDEPTVVAYNKNTKKVLAIGTKAKEMLGRESAEIEVIRPLKQGVISDYSVTEQMLKDFIKKAMSYRRFKRRPKVCVCVPSGVTEVEKRSAEDAVYHTGAKYVAILEEPVAAAIGAGLNIEEACGRMVVDIGGGTSDIAVISLGGIVVNHSLKVAGDDFDEALIKYVKNNFNILIGQCTAEAAKIAVGSVYPTGQDMQVVVKGRNLINGLPDGAFVSSIMMREAFKEVADQIIEAIRGVLEATPPELTADIVRGGIMLSGGGSLISGLPELIEEETGIHAYVNNVALEAVAVGAGVSVEN